VRATLACNTGSHDEVLRRCCALVLRSLACKPHCIQGPEAGEPRTQCQRLSEAC
jgi:hypothetical protein